MKKIIAVILALTMLLALAACTAKTETTTTDTAADAATTTDTAAEQPADTEAEQPTDTNGDVTTITLAMHVSNTQEQEPAVYQAIQAFQQENPDVKIELVEHLTEEHNKQLKLWAQSGELPDIFWCQEGDVLEYGENGYLLPLNDFLSQNPDIDSAIPDAIKNCYAGENGEIYGLAYTSLVTGFYYNKAIFADNGLPELTNETTYEELLDMVKTLHDNGVTTFAQGAMTNYSVWGYLGSLNRYGYAENIAAIADGSQSSAVFSKLLTSLQSLAPPAHIRRTWQPSTISRPRTCSRPARRLSSPPASGMPVKSAKHSARTSASGGARPIRIPIIRRKPATSSQTARSL